MLRSDAARRRRTQIRSLRAPNPEVSASRHDPASEQRHGRPDEAEAPPAGMRPLVLYVLIRPFVEAYRLVADVPAASDAPDLGNAEIVWQTLGLGHQ